MKGNYEEDLILISSYREGDVDAMVKLLTKYDPLITKEASEILYMDFEDAKQEMAENFIIGVNRFDERRDIYFPYYIRNILHWERLRTNESTIDRYNHEELDEEAGMEELIYDEKKEDEEEVVNVVVAYFHLTEEQKIILDAIMSGEPVDITARNVGCQRRQYFRKKKAFLEWLKEHGNEIRGML